MRDHARFDRGRPPLGHRLLRFNIVSGTGKPTNDVLGYGVFGRYRLDDRWTVGLGVDVSDELDIERTPELVGLVQDPEAPVVDSKGSEGSSPGFAYRF